MTGFRFDVRSDTKRVVAEFTTGRFGDQTGLVARAQARALNRTVDQLRTKAGRLIREEYSVTLRGIRQASRVLKARPSSKFPVAKLTFSGRPINLFEFKARAVNPWNVAGGGRRRGGGVSVQVKVRGGRKLIQNAFITTLKSGQNAGKKGVFRREGRARYPIKFLPSISLPRMAEQRAIRAAMLSFSQVRYEENLRHELEFLMSGRS